MANLELAEQNARKGKQHRACIQDFDKDREYKLLSLQRDLAEGDYKTSEYSSFKIYEPKEREIFKLPYYPDRIVHHAIINILGESWIDILIPDTYACIKGRGIHAAANKVKEMLREDVKSTTYCLKIDIRKYFPSINKDIMKAIVTPTICDQKLLKVVCEIIDSSENGLPIGNYLSQYLSNLYLNGFDHYVKNDLKVKNYVRYADDMVFLSSSKSELWGIFNKISVYLYTNLRLTIKPNYQVFKVDDRGIDFVGYVFRHTHTGLRKSIKVSFAKKVHKMKYYAPQIIKNKTASWYGWCVHCNAVHLIKKLYDKD